MKIILTGATGFVGGHILEKLSDWKVLTIGRSCPRKGVTSDFYKAEIGRGVNFRTAFSEGDVVIHCAARAHIMRDVVENPLEVYREVNTQGTLELASQAASSGVKRFIFVSTIKVNGEKTELGMPFTSEDVVMPAEPYAISKYEAEVGLKQIAESSGMEVVVIRPPLVYGPGVGANFAAMLNVVSKGVPLPFGCVHKNKRSMVFIYNLVDLIVTCIDHPKAGNQIFLVSDGEDLSTRETVRSLACAFGRRLLMFPIPVFLFRFAGRLLGKGDVVGRVVDSLQVDIGKTRECLGWTPPYSIDVGFKKTVTDFCVRKG